MRRWQRTGLPYFQAFIAQITEADRRGVKRSDLSRQGFCIERPIELCFLLGDFSGIGGVAVFLRRGLSQAVW